MKLTKKETVQNKIEIIDPFTRNESEKKDQINDKTSKKSFSFKLNFALCEWTLKYGHKSTFVIHESFKPV